MYQIMISIICQCIPLKVRFKKDKMKKREREKSKYMPQKGKKIIKEYYKETCFQQIKLKKK